MKRDPRIAKVSANAVLRFGITESAKMHRSLEKGTTMSSQTVPWGVNRVRGPVDGTGKNAWIPDSGIDMNNPTLNVDSGNSISFISGQSPQDINGHGTHVAGILAAKDDGIDVVGVAAGATVVSVKVCHQTTGCPANIVMDGVDYVANQAQPQDIVNISLWAEVDSDNEDAMEDLESSILTAATIKGIRFTLIAGNAADDASEYSPGRIGHQNVWTMSAFGQNDAFAIAFSNYGNPPINFSGPGVNIPSLAIGGGVTNMDGTSMATPHVAGILLATGSNPVPTDGTVSNDPSPPVDRIAVAPSDLNASIFGPSFVSNGNQGNWTAQVSDGVPPYSIQWYRNIEGNPPFWQQVGSGSSYSTTVTQSFELQI